MKSRRINAATYSDELPDESELREIPDIALHRVGSEASGIPVERWAQVVGEPVAWIDRVDATSEFFSLGIYGLLRLHPQQVSVRRKRDRPVDRAESSALVAVVTLPGPRRVPIPVRRVRKTELSLGDIKGIGVGEVGNPLEELGLADRTVLRLDCTCKDGGESRESGRLNPFVLNDLEGVPGPPCLLGFQHNGDERPQRWVRRTEDKRVVALVDVGCD